MSPAASKTRPTIVDVARSAGVSVGTVSHVLSGRRPVRPETRTRVEEAIRSLGFRPNTVARSLIGRRTQTVGMVVPDVTNPFFAELIWQIERAMADADHAVIFGNSANDPGLERRYLESFLARRLDAVIVAVSGADLDAAREVAHDIPTVFVDRPVALDADTVVGDNRAGMALAVEHLVGLGHRRIGFLGGDPRLGTTQERQAGMNDALAERGLVLSASSAGRFTLASGYEQACAMLTAESRPTAICAANDLLAMGALKAAAELGLRVPEDVSLVGYDDIPYAAFTSPPLTTVRQPGAAIGEETARLVISRVAGYAGQSRRVVLAPELVVRGSSGPPQQ